MIGELALLDGVSSDRLNVELFAPPNLAGSAGGGRVRGGNERLGGRSPNCVREHVDGEAFGRRLMRTVGAIQSDDHVEVDDAASLKLGNLAI